MAENYQWVNSQTNALFRAILGLKTIEEYEKFFRDLLTLEEIKEFATRWQIVLSLDKGMSYRDIALKTKTSTTTVARVAHWLYYGTGGYRLALGRTRKK